MVAETSGGAVVVVYSGEVYNFAELRTELRARGHRFRSRSDTEVVLRGYLEWGNSVAQRLTGMWAFAIWDARDQRLRLMRDPLGIRPLYMMPTRDGVLFGSEPKAVLGVGIHLSNPFAAVPGHRRAGRYRCHYRQNALEVVHVGDIRAA